MITGIGNTNSRKEFNEKLCLMRLALVEVTLVLFSCPLLYAAPSGSEVLSRLQVFDKVYESGLTASALSPGEAKNHRPRGGRGAGLPDRILPPIGKNWKLVMAGERSALVVKSVEVPLSTFRPVALTDEEAKAERGRPGVEGEDRTFWGPDYTAKFEVHGVYSRENDRVKMIDQGTMVTFLLPDDTSHNIPLNKFLWSMGRGYSKYIFELSSVVELKDGTIKCSGPGTDSPHDKDPARWELIVDPAADYMVRSAKFTEEGDDKPSYKVTTSGTKSMNGRIVPETATWRATWMETPMLLTFQHVTQEPNYAFLETTEKMMFGPYAGTTQVEDERMTPTFYQVFRAGQKYDTFPIIRQTLVGRALEGLECFNLELDENQIKDKMILVCFWDMNQRPSRHFIKQLAGKAEELKQEGIIVVTVQFSKVEKKVLNEWLTKNKMPFPVGVVKDNEEKIRHEWAVKSLPWLILTDGEHTVREEGFNIDELDNKTKAIRQISRASDPSTLSGSELLSRLRAFDETFESGMYAEFLAPGYREIHLRTDKIVPTPEKHGKITMADGRCVIVTKSKKVPLSTFRTAASTPEEEGKDTLKSAIEAEAHNFYGPKFRARFDIDHRYEVDEKGKVTEGSACGWVYITEPDRVMWNLVRRRIVWRMGRGFAKQIYEFTRVVKLPDGMLKCTGRGKSVGLGEGRWELVIDPANAYLVRSAKYYEDYEEGTPLPDAPHLLITTSGTKSMNRCIIAEAGYWAEPLNTNLLDQPLGPLVVNYITNEPNYALLEATKKIMFGPYKLTTSVTDSRLKPHWGRIFEAGQEYESFSVIRYSLVGRPLEGLEEFDLKLDENQIKDKMILVCFWDMNQRPSRHFIRQLAGKAGDLKQKDVIVVAVQASDVEKKVLNEWLTKNKIAFPVGIVKEDWEKTRHEWAIKSLPWLILTDGKHVVTAEGFGLEELNAKIK